MNPQQMALIMDQMGINDPKLRMFAELMGNQTQENQFQQASEQSDVPGEDMTLIMKENETLIDENRALRSTIDYLAYALGACPECWGNDCHCDVCMGRGGSGYYLPDREAFAECVIPAIDKLRELKQKKASLKRNRSMSGHQTEDNHMKTASQEAVIP